MKKEDAIGRRDRYIQQPTGKNVRIQDSDIQILEFNHIHGGVGLPTSYLFGAGSHTDYNSFEKRMVLLRHEARLFETGLWQKRTDYPRANCLVNTNTEAADQLLKAHGLWSPHTPKRSGSPYHDTYMSCVLASFRKAMPYRWTPQHQILERAGKLNIEVNGFNGSPDAIGKVTLDRDVLLFFEIDRATEPVRTLDSTRRSWQQKVRFYRQLIGHGAYKDIFDVNCGALLLILTVSNSNLQNILSVVHEEFNGSCNYMAGQSYEQFGYSFHPPKEYLPVVQNGWERCGYEPFSFQIK